MLRTKSNLSEMPSSTGGVGGVEGAEPETSVERTIRRTPAVIRRMTPTRRQENFSSRKRKANVRTKMRDEDLHIAKQVDVRLETRMADQDMGSLTVQGQGDCSQAQIRQTNIQACCDATGQTLAAKEVPD